MKKIFFMLLLVILLVGYLFSETQTGISLNVEKQQADQNPKAYFGISLSQLTFLEAYQKHYEKNYGAEVTTVATNSSAQKCGLRRGDILMEFDGEKIYSHSQFASIINGKRFGDKVKIKYFRNGKIFEKEVILGKREEKKINNTVKKYSKKRKFSTGYGGGSWVPMWFMPDFSELNDIAQKLNFDKPFDENGFLMQGGAGKGPVGKGIFIGGFGQGYENSQTVKHLWALNNVQNDTINVSRKLKYKVTFGGFTLDKRMAFSRKLIGSIGFMLGSGNIKMSVYQKYNDVENIDFSDNLNDNIDDNYSYKSSLVLKNSFIAFQPKAELLFRINKWFAIRAEAGYILSYSPKGWKITRNGDSISAQNKPDTTLNALTFSIGPWFGF